MKVTDLWLLSGSNSDYVPRGAGHPFQSVARLWNGSYPHAIDRLVPLMRGHEHDLIARGGQRPALFAEDPYVGRRVSRGEMSDFGC